ncbi:glycosyl transferase [Pacificimonas sp. WHA3]|uniref:Peptide O-xylosyltransferase n=1 Tax=Pacificimonas pallii TaxID=2827236 RepID=A0ABS6SI40_9SPHN|nr:beta-1,6-N-acetylglucosaminyltransferase [Pacificimonas pallii]MBV7257925.1 glycosyl transferase [Pacificimonas pallii]
MIAYFILVHRYPEQFKRMFRAVYQPGNQYLVHIDKMSGPELARDISMFLQPYQGTEILPAKDALWGGFSLVDAELRGMKRLLEMNSHWTHFINLSGQDFPLKSQDEIKTFLADNPGKQFIRAVDQHTKRPETLNRIKYRFVEAFGRMFHTGIPRKFLTGVTPWIGTQWKVVDRNFCKFVTSDPRVVRYRKFYKGSFIADESFFQTVMMNVGEHGEVMNDDLRTIDWIPDGDVKLRPRNFGIADAQWLIKGRNLFARKFDSTEDNAVLDFLETHLSKINLPVTPISVNTRKTVKIIHPFGPEPSRVAA